MTIKNLKEVFATGTKITIKTTFECDTDAVEGFTVTLKLLGNAAFMALPVEIRSVSAVGIGEVEIAVDMPYSVFKAWQKYSQED